MPVHPALLPAMRRWCKESKDGYVIAGITATTHDRRGADLSSAFSALKSRKNAEGKLWFDFRYVFHNGFRGLVSGELRDAGVALSTIKGIVGHKDRDLTTGKYPNKEVPLAVKNAAIKKLDYGKV